VHVAIEGGTNGLDPAANVEQLIGPDARLPGRRADRRAARTADRAPPGTLPTRDSPRRSSVVAVLRRNPSALFSLRLAEQRPEATAALLDIYRRSAWLLGTISATRSSIKREFSAHATGLKDSDGL
jgi:hypothetical protein